jgi:DNA replication ATP-dependent helicase Dna2
MSAETKRTRVITGSGVNSDIAATNACFLCAFSPRRCDVPSVEGRLLGVWERAGGGPDPAVLLACPDGATAYVTLNAQARPLARELLRHGRARWCALTLRVFHLEHDTTGGLQPDATGDVAGADAFPLADALDPDANRDPGAAAPHAHSRRRLRAIPASVAVLEPDLLLNITDINNAAYCVRQYPLRRLVPSPPTEAAIRGKVVHAAFQGMLKSGDPDVATFLRRALDAQLADLALREISYARAQADAEPHLRALAAWYTSQRSSLWGDAPRIRAETFLLASEIGLKGRLDFLLQDAHGGSLLELKSGEVGGQIPKRDHRWQVYGYQTLLAVRRPADRARPGATLLYSGTPGQAEAYGIPFTLRDLQRVLELRNALALTHATGVVPRPPGGNTCARCMLRRVCLRASSALGWEPPPGEEPDEPVAPEDAALIATYYELLRQEARAAESDARRLWLLSPAERCAAGSAIGELAPVGEPRPTPSGEWEYTFACDHASELRENDAILLSDGDPVRGAAVTGTILALSDRQVTVWTREPLANPRLIDRYESEMVHDRTVRNLWRWLETDPHLRALVNGTRAPSFDPLPADAEPPATFNPEQRLAVARALAARDFLLIQGPPGTGKTSVVAEIARRAMARGERVLVAAFTNQAVDNVLRRLVVDGVHDLVRLGHELSVAPELRSYRLAPRAEQAARALAGEASPAPPGGVASRGSLAVAPLLDPALLRVVLARTPLVASTAATWSSETYDGAGEPLRFDLALVDEATQLTMPALLGILRFTRRFVLVGDDQQLPPLVRSEEAVAGGLKRSLFIELLERWGERATAALTRQYRMHPAICGFPSCEFYRGALLAEGEARTALLTLDPPPAGHYAAVLDAERPLVLVDVPEPESADASADDQIASHAGTLAGSKASPVQAEVTRTLVLALRRAGVGAHEIGVIAPYRAQVALIRRRLAAAGEDGVTVDTVDRFQGAECPVILLSLGGIASERGGDAFLADPQRLNVALTRAQRKLIVIAYRRRMEAHPLLRRLVEYCRLLYDGRGGIVTARSAPLPNK